jgi:hypothetical protein
VEWQGVITGARDRPLGTLESVAADLTTMFPGLSFEWSRTGVDELAILGARGVELPDLVRRVVAAKPSYLCGSLEDGPLSVSFNLGTGDPVTTIWATVRGDQAAAEAALTGLRRRAGWVLTLPGPLALEAVGPNESLHLTGGPTLVFETPQPPGTPPAGEH